MTPQSRGRLAAVGSLVAAAAVVYGIYELFGSPGVKPQRLAPPTLAALAGDGDARLTWSVPSEQLRLVEQWEYEQSDSRAGTAPKHSTGSSATSYLVSGLTNGETYSFRVRAILKPGAGKVANWSNTVSATPMQVGDVLERIARHQRGMERHQWSMARQQGAMARQQGEMARQQGRIADSASAATAFIAEDRMAFRGLAARGVLALERLAEASESTGNGCTDCPGNHDIHHTTFAFRFAPPWFGADHRSLFTSYVVFPEEAKFEDWIGGERGEICEGEEAPPSVCPETAFYEKTMGSFLEGVSHCATTDKVELHMVGFASSTKLNESLGERGEELEKHYKNHIRAQAELCKDGRAERAERAEDETDHSNMFNLLIANERADNAAAMLQEIVAKMPKDAFTIKAIPWCSYAAMADERDFDDGKDPIKGLMNRRVEVHLVELPNC